LSPRPPGIEDDAAVVAGSIALVVAKSAWNFLVCLIGLEDRIDRKAW